MPLPLEFNRFVMQPNPRSDVIVPCHGGPIAEPEDVRYVLDRTQAVVGFFGASSVERLPTEQAITAQVREFKATARGSISKIGAGV